MSLDEIIKEALTLPRGERAWLADHLLESLNSSPTDDTTRSLWIKEANKRLHELRSGLVQGIPCEAAMARLREKYK